MSVIAPARAVADRRPDPSLARTALEIARTPAMWRHALRFSDTERVHALVHADEHMEAWLLTWLPGQGTELHDHGDSAGAFAVIAGRLHEVVPGEAPGGRPMGPGAVRAFGTAHVHQVVNLAAVPAVSLHVYAPRLHTMTRYALVGGALEATGVARAGADW